MVGSATRYGPSRLTRQASCRWGGHLGQQRRRLPFEATVSRDEATSSRPRRPCGHQGSRQPRCTDKLRRILVPGGRLLFIEHVASDESGLRRWQDRMHWLNRIVGHGCECNRATLDSILAAGFSVSDLRRDTLPRVPAILRPLLIGCAESTKQPRP